MNLPIGSIIAWHKSFANTPALPAGWVECNGQTLDDELSPYDGQVIPNLNGEGRFLRGGATSGVLQDDAVQGHFHEVHNGTYGLKYGTYGASASGAMCAETSGPGVYKARQLSSDGTNGTPRIASETRPKNMSVVWIMKVAEYDGVVSVAPGRKVILQNGRVEFHTIDVNGNWELEKAIEVDGEYVAPEDDTYHQVGASGEPAYQNNWVAMASSPVRFIKLGSAVFISGGADGGNQDTVMFTLPVGYRPAVQKIYSRANIFGETRIEINPDGTVYVEEWGLSHDADFTGGFSFSL